MTGNVSLLESCQPDLPQSRNFKGSVGAVGGQNNLNIAALRFGAMAPFVVYSQNYRGSRDMKQKISVGLAMLAGIAIGAVAVQGLHAQAKPPVYTVSEIQISNNDGYIKEFVPIATASIKAAGGKPIAGGPGTSLEGAPPATRITIQSWDSLQQAQAWRNGAEYKKAREIGDKYAKFRAFAVEGTP
jgi:uncharacterized protein (DUF1330 family)